MSNHGTDVDYHVDGLLQDCSISSALAMEILQSCTKPLVLPVWVKFSNPFLSLQWFHDSNHQLARQRIFFWLPLVKDIFTSWNLCVMYTITCFWKLFFLCVCVRVIKLPQYSAILETIEYIRSFHSCSTLIYKIWNADSSVFVFKKGAYLPTV